MKKNLIVKKFGGSSLANVQKVKVVASIIEESVFEGKFVIVIVSAPAGFTDNMFSSLKEMQCLDSLSCRGESAVVLTAGEQISCGLLTAYLKKKGILAKSFLAWQLPIITDDTFLNSRIKYVETKNITEFFNEGGKVAVVAGFQGITGDMKLTTLGRGGSDTTAVAVAASVGADVCEIYTDVEGVFTADPNVVENAEKIDTLTFEEMLEMASLGSKVMHVKAIEIAMLTNVKLYILSTFTKNRGTLITVGGENNMYFKEKSSVTAVAHVLNEAGISLFGEKLSILEVFKELADAGINVDMIAKTLSNSDNSINGLTFSISFADVEIASSLLSKNKDLISYSKLIVRDNLSKVSVVGVAMISNPGIAYMLVKVLHDAGINIEAITTSEMKISVLIPREYCAKAVKVIHESLVIAKI